MNKKPKFVYGIKGKLVSAACMLLVAVIMVVSSTYAWFTLSTAPEVTGINTAIGANGSLEMALVPKDGSNITSNVGDSMDDWTIKNNTWGNLVNLETGYGLDEIVLYPSQLNQISGVIGSAPLMSPTYGSDGRVEDVLANTVMGTFDSTDSTFKTSTDLGVRAVGVASGMTARQTDFRNARSAASTAMVLAKTKAGQSLNENGATLANVALKKAMGKEDYSQEDVAALLKIVTDLTKEGGVLAQIETAYMQLLLAYAASSLSGTDDVAYLAVKGIVEGENATLDSTLAKLQEYYTGLEPAFLTAINEFNATKTKVTEAETALKDMADDGDNATFTWATISVPLYKLADTENMEINGFKASEVKEKLGDVVSSVTAQGGLIVTMKTGGGVYADVADHCGDYQANVVIEKIEYNGIVLNNMTATMKTVTTSKYLTIYSEVLNGKAPAGAAEGTTQNITEFYGYIIDLAFRTNAPDSDLLLSTAKDRIYSDNANPETMGGGSTMTFESGVASEFGIDKVKELMRAIRVVFFTPTEDGSATTGTIVAEARLDVDGATGNTARLCLVDASGNLIKEEAQAVIMPLIQNSTTKLSVLVYLDGATIGNDDVAATVAQSVTGSLNLQFASSATLVPMDYAGQHQPAQGTN